MSSCCSLMALIMTKVSACELNVYIFVAIPSISPGYVMTVSGNISSRSCAMIPILPVDAGTHHDPL
jgi:hypothetical protein